jgi:hypothetical protein
LLACLCSIAHAQTHAPPDTTALKRHKWELAADLLSLTGKHNLPPASLLLRYNLTTRKGKHRAVRLRVGADYRETKSKQTIGSSLDGVFGKYSLMARLGYEWQKTKGKFQHYAGIDAQTQFDKSLDNLTDLTQFPSYYDERIIYAQIFRLGAVGFVGAKYFIHPRIAISGEACVEVYRAWQRQKEDYIQYPINILKDRKEFRNDFWVSNFNALYVFQVSYLFR